MRINYCIISGISSLLLLILQGEIVRTSTTLVGQVQVAMGNLDLNVQVYHGSM